VVSRVASVLRPDPHRVITQLFVPGHEQLIHGQSRVDPVTARILDLDPQTVDETLATTLALFGDRHRDLPATLNEHFDLVAHRLGTPAALSTSARLLIGAYFTHEYALEAAAVTNPSIVAHPDQAGVPVDQLRVLLSLRAIGEGHRSSIEFRTGLITADGQLHIDEPGRYVTTGRRCESRYDRQRFHRALRNLGDGEDALYIVDSLPDPFTDGDLDQVLTALQSQRVTRPTAERTTEHARQITANNYEVAFTADTPLSERALLPRAPTESQGMEDLRLTRFIDDDETITYHGTYTAYDGQHVTPQLLTTTDFQSFQVAQLTGPAAVNKGMALFPRPVHGRRLALSRWDRENISIAASSDGYRWEQATTIAMPRHEWEIIQIGNCGSPIETADGWLVLTHGVGPMRRYAIGAMLLDIDDPTRVRGRLSRPLIGPSDTERDGYVPNVTYTCGAIAHHDRLVMPYGSADSAVGVATIDLPRLLHMLQDSTHRPT
jgi:predicted GH43/DUF377 family glycosyl hydrolase